MSDGRGRAVLFDFDYTLADSSNGVVECMTRAFRDLALATPEPDQIRRTIGLTLEETFETLTRGRTPDLTADFVRLYVEYADVKGGGATSFYPPVVDTLAELRVRGFSLAIVSTKYRYRIEQVLERDGLGGAVDVIVGGEDTSHGKPDPAGLELALARLALHPDAAVYVGDHPVDALAAAAARVPFVLTSTGLSESHEFEAPIAARIDDLSGLAKLLPLR